MHGHHAILYVGPHDACLARVPKAHRSGADALVHVAERLTIDAARTIRVQAQSRPVSGDKRSFVISCAEFNREAQNALLKLLEDPPATAQFHIIAPRLSALLPTVRSRLSIVYVADTDTDASTAVSFLDAPYAVRLAQIATLAAAKDAAGMRTLIADIERACVRRGVRTGLSDVALASMYAAIVGGSPKMLLEHVALSLPGGRG